MAMSAGALDPLIHTTRNGCASSRPWRHCPTALAASAWSRGRRAFPGGHGSGRLDDSRGQDAGCGGAEVLRRQLCHEGDGASARHGLARPGELDRVDAGVVEGAGRRPSTPPHRPPRRTSAPGRQGVPSAAPGPTAAPGQSSRAFGHRPRFTRNPAVRVAGSGGPQPTTKPLNRGAGGGVESRARNESARPPVLRHRSSLRTDPSDRHAVSLRDRCQGYGLSPAAAGQQLACSPGSSCGTLRRTNGLLKGRRA